MEEDDGPLPGSGGVERDDIQDMSAWALEAQVLSLTSRGLSLLFMGISIWGGLDGSSLVFFSGGVQPTGNTYETTTVNTSIPTLLAKEFVLRQYQVRSCFIYPGTCGPVLGATPLAHI